MPKKTVKPSPLLPGFLILAAGKGKRMRSTLPKVLCELNGAAMISHVLRSIGDLERRPSIGVIVGHQRELVEGCVSRVADHLGLNVTFIFQEQQLGTGDAVKVAMESKWGKKLAQNQQPLLVLPGDSPLVSTELLRSVSEPFVRGTAVRMVSCHRSDPKGYGRVVRRGKKGAVLRIVEEADANARERQITEVATSVYLFESKFLKAGLGSLTSKNVQKEYYLPDLVAFAVRRKKKVDTLVWERTEELMGINTSWELTEATEILNEKILRRWADMGVRIMDRRTTWVDASVELAEGVELHPGVVLRGKTRVGKNVEIQARCVLTDVVLEENVLVRVGTVADSSIVRKAAKVGPYAHLRPGSDVGEDSKIGNFVELKKTSVGSRTSVAHLSYLGDAEVGSDVNIGCGFVTCNFDGRVIRGERKHRTVIEDQVFLGSDCQTVAPVTIKKGAYIASGSTITKDVPENALGIARSRQENKAGFAARLRSRNDVSNGKSDPERSQEV